MVVIAGQFLFKWLYGSGFHPFDEGNQVAARVREQGYLPEAMLNFLALLGWSLNDKTEIMSFLLIGMG